MMDVDRIKQTAQMDQVQPALVFKEQVQLVVLEYLFRKGLFARLVFQGGTALRLAYQGVRYSEDLDFVLKERGPAVFASLGKELHGLAVHVKKHLPAVAGVRLKPQKETETFCRYALSLETDFLSAKDLTNIEIANVPAYEHQVVMIRHPELAMAPAVAVESPREILSDKIVAFAARSYIKGRDLWDVYFLVETMKVTAGPEVVSMVRRKINDYGLKLGEFFGMIDQKAGLLDKDGVQILHEEMDRFLPAAYRDMYAPRYPAICALARRIFTRVAEGLNQ
jgi:predicted nucleotidyltransferase component of viral defense system